MTIIITTFKYRFEKYLKPLINKIKSIAPDIELIVLINGENGESFDNNFRKEMLLFLAEFNNTFPVFFPMFRGLSKLWNTGIIHSSNDEILLLNDDITIENNNVFKEIWGIFTANFNKPFKINGSWSHVMLNKAQIVNNNLWFNEKLLGIGEEDGYFEWMYNNVIGESFKSFNVNGIVNHVDMTHNPTNTRVINQGKYSKLNGEVMLSEIFEINDNGIMSGMFPHKVILKDNSVRYPDELFYRSNKDKL